MHAIRTLVALSIAALAAACAGTGDTGAAMPCAGMAPMAMAAAGPMTAVEPRMKAMQEMHQKMVHASTASERQALMADHMHAMHGGMAMMQEMQAMHTGSGKAGMGGMGGMGVMGASGGCAAMAGMGDGNGMSVDMARRHQMMSNHMVMMQSMMDMMADRMPPAPMAK